MLHYGVDEVQRCSSLLVMCWSGNVPFPQLTEALQTCVQRQVYWQCAIQHIHEGLPCLDGSIFEMRVQRQSALQQAVPHLRLKRNVNGSEQADIVFLIIINKPFDGQNEASGWPVVQIRITALARHC